MQPNLMVRIWMESTLAGAGFFLAILTLVQRDWIEATFGVDPDFGSGALEWAIVGSMMSAAFVCTVLAVQNLRRAQPR